MTPEEYLAEIAAMHADGTLDEHDHAMARSRALAAARRGQPLPALPGRSRTEDPHARRTARCRARRERHETGMTRADQRYRDAVDARLAHGDLPGGAPVPPPPRDDLLTRFQRAARALDLGD